MKLRFLRLMFVALLFLLSVIGEGQQRPTSDTSSVEGVIIDAGTGQPLADVRVWTDRSAGGEFTPTDQSGRFKLTGVPSGTRSIRVRKQGYALAKSVGLKTPGLAAAADLVNVEPGKPLQGVIIQLVPEGTISGRILPGGRPRTIVNLARYTYGNDGERTLIAVESVPISTQTDNWGEYRFEGLEAGEYYIYFNPSLISAAKGEAAPLTYYPDAFDVTSASRLIVKPGTNLRLNDLEMTLSVRAALVRFRMIDATGDSNADKGCPSVWWKPRGVSGHDVQGLVTICTGTSSNLTMGAYSLAPGLYDAYVGWNIGNRFAFGMPSQPLEGASISFEVRDADLELDVAVSRARLSGRILIEQPDGKVIPAAGLQFSLKPKGAGPTIETKTAADGSFRQDRLGSGYYAVEFSDLPIDAYIAELTEAQRNVLADGLEIGSTDLQLNGVISLRGGIVEGTIQKGAGAVVVLVPEPQPPANHYRDHVISTNQNGEFSIRGIAPASYRLFAWSALEGAAYKNYGQPRAVLLFRATLR